MAAKNKSPLAISKKRRTLLLICGICGLTLLVLIDHSKLSPASKRHTSQKEQNISDIARYHQKKFLITNVVDGDTVDINAPDGKRQYTRVRLLGIDTPETEKSPVGKMYFGSEATNFTKTAALNKNVTILMDDKQKPRDRYNRLLAYIKLPSGQILNEKLISDGFAYADLRFKHKYYYKYLQLEEAARKNKKGLWKQVSQKQLPLWLQKRKPKLLKK